MLDAKRRIGMSSVEQFGADVRVVDRLIVATLDNSDEYRRAIFAIEQQLCSLQAQLAARTQSIEQMQRHVRSLGAEPAVARSSLASAFATVLNARVIYRKDAEGSDTLA